MVFASNTMQTVRSSAKCFEPVFSLQISARRSKIDQWSIAKEWLNISKNEVFPSLGYFEKS